MNFIQKCIPSYKNNFLAATLILASISAGPPHKYDNADPSSYAISLYGVNADSLDSVSKSPSGFVQFTRNGAAIWKINVRSAGSYSLRAVYACDQPGISLRIAVGERSLDIDLPATRGYYTLSSRNTPRGKIFPNGIGNVLQNYERLDLREMIWLNAGENTVSLSVKVPSGSAPFFFRSLELLPLHDQKAARVEIQEAEKARANPGWLIHAGYGLMFHWTSETMPRSGAQMSYANAVQSFNVPAFADMVKKTGAKYVIFTGNHVHPHFPAPLKEWEMMHPGRTTKRDLIGEIADALNTRGIKLILYIHVTSMADTTIKKDHSDMSTTQFSDEAIKLISEIGHRYGARIAGYWFDDFYEIETRYQDFPYKLYYKACKAGNPDRLVALTNWIYPNVTLWQDYWGGELFVTGNPPTSLPQTDGPGKGLPFQALLALYGDWVHVWKNTPIKPPIFTVDELGNFINATKGKGAVTLNTGIYQDGTIGEEQTKYFEQLRKLVYGN